MCDEDADPAESWIQVEEWSKAAACLREHDALSKAHVPALGDPEAQAALNAELRRLGLELHDQDDEYWLVIRQEGAP